MVNNNIRIAIDGPAAAGKSTVARKIAERLSIVYIDTGAMYRALTLKALQNNVNIEDEQSLIHLLKKTTIQLKQTDHGQIVYLDHKDVSSDIRTQAVSNAVSIVAKHRLIREEMVDRQRKLADNINVVMDGRDVGTHILPMAEVKIFLIASVEERALRRHKENISKGFSSDLDQLKQEIIKRDERDSKRASSPLVQADDAIAIDTTSLSIEEVVEKILKEVSQFHQ
ncbi:(d)CMP kinase [Pseudogracilibacillus auburnensis]|uniref:Cytidylate kinase n=1 Tax=Pseudogracilibacillus auburnensis TaxID=1494959 RepID=A0A2V3W6S6_9BACI|nr:(d)CMP kinase [Pseudogracilibacillus auburnensis]PXW88731.1 cytidylate kinase [Pseudogracilibacillus auburnensis]